MQVTLERIIKKKQKNAFGALFWIGRTIKFSTIYLLLEYGYLWIEMHIEVLISVVI